MNPSLVSIILPVFNNHEGLQRAIDSVKRQTYTGWELIVVDDCSDEEVYPFALSLLEEGQFTVIRNEENRGAGASRNRGIANAKGRYLAFLDADDCWHPTKLQVQIGMMHTENSAISCTAYEALSKRRNQKKIITPKNAISYRDLLNTCGVGLSTVVIDKTKIGHVEFPVRRRREDWLLWLQLTNCGYIIDGFNVILTYYDLDDRIAKKAGLARTTWDVYRNELNMSIVKAIYHFIQYAWHGVRKTY